MGRKNILPLLLFLLLILNLPVYDKTIPAAEKPLNLYKKKVYTSKDGLPTNSVFDIVQTPDGFIWLATDAGIARFDGVDFEVFDKDSTPGISDNLISCLLVDSRGTLWIGTENGGIIRFKNGIFGEKTASTDTATPSPGKNPHSGHRGGYTREDGLLNNYVRDIAESRDGALWIGTVGGLNRLESGKISTVPLPAAASNRTVFPPGQGSRIIGNDVKALVEDSRGQLWIGTGDGLLKLTQKGKNYEVQPACFAGFFIIDLMIDEENNLWIGTMENGVIRLHLPSGRRFYFSKDNGLSSSLISSLYRDPGGVTWVCTKGGGLNRMGKNRLSAFNVENGFSHRDVTSVFKDREGNLWIGTNGGGLNLMSDSRVTAYHTGNGLSSDQVYGIFQDSHDAIWVGSFGAGVNCIENGRVEQRLSKKNGFPSNFVLTVCEDREGNMWFGTYGTGAVQRKNGRFISYTRQHGLETNFVYGLYTDRRGRLWAGTNKGGLHLFTGERFSLVRKLKGKVRAFLEDSRGNLWVGTDITGLVRLKGEETEFFDETRGLSHHDIMAIYEDKTGAIWVATFGEGLNRFKNGRFQSIKKKDGLPHDIIYWILEDDSNNLWFSSMAGIARVPRSDLEDFFAGKSPTVTCTNFDEADGMKIHECNGGSQAAGLRASDGRLWFTTVAGIAMIDPREIREEMPPPPVAIKKILIDGKEYSPRPELEITPGKGNIEIHYTGLSFVLPERLRFRYRLEGYEKEWRPPVTRRTAYYTNIPPGSYYFRVQAAGHEGRWSEKSASLRLVIMSNFWQTWWFKIIGLFFILFLVRLFYIFKTRSLKARQQELEDIVTERTHSLKQKTAALENKRAALEKINNIVKAINAAVDYKDILSSMLKETAVLNGIKHAVALVYDKSIDAYIFKAALGYDVDKLTMLRLSFREAEDRYIKGSSEIFKDIFIARDIAGRPGEEKMQPYGIPASMLILKLRWEDTAVGYLLFENMEDKNAFDKQDISLLEELKAHIALAFIKSKLLLELETEREAAEEGSRAKSMFLARMSHEIRTPMNSVIGFAEMLKNSQLNPEQQEFVQNISGSGEALLNLIDEILDFSKIEAGRFPLQIAGFDPRASISEVCRLIKPRLMDKPIKISCSVGDSIPAYVRGDEGRFRQVLVNLMGNAAKFTRSGEITLSLHVESETANKVKLHAAVRDTGIGIPGDQQESIFEMFQQADGTIGRDYGGTGLGLAISRQIANLMAGDVWVESEVGQGSTFHFTAFFEKSQQHSRADDSPAAGQEESCPGETGEAVTSPYILLVEDNAVNRRLAQFMLTKGGCRLDMVHNGREAVDTYSADPGKYDLIFMDVNMPQMDGLEAARLIREKGFTDVPIVAITAHALKEDRQKCLDAGMNDYISKPIKQGAVFGMIKKWVR
ncbi:MAG: response regulator [Candidatus Aminicenantes bacterium]|nr:response regulator [Candidatus Aminicenantes bacterium]